VRQELCRIYCSYYIPDVAFLQEGRVRNMKKEWQKYTIWIEAEQWVPGTWNPEDTNEELIKTGEFETTFTPLP
jgi:hypothetical protein